MAENFKQKFAFFSRYGYRKSSGINMELKIFQGPFFPIIFSLCALRAFLCLQWPQNDSPYFRAQVKPENSQLMPKTVYKKIGFCSILPVRGLIFPKRAQSIFPPPGICILKYMHPWSETAWFPCFL